MEVKIHKGQGKLQHVVEIGAHRLLTDEAPLYGGENTGPNPHELLAASLGACTSMTLVLYARRKGWPLHDAQVRIEHKQDGNAYLLKCHIHYVGELDGEQRARLNEIAMKCPIHKILSGEIRIDTQEE